MLCVIIPTLNCETLLRDTIDSIAEFSDDIIVSDGLSVDGTLRIALKGGARLALGCSGRGWQLARAARFSSADWLLFLHADTILANGWQDAAHAHMKDHPQRAGYFKFKLNGRGWKPRLAECLVNLRCRVFAFPYGDQGLLISRALYDEVGGYPKIDLFEDVTIVRALGKRRLRRLDCAAITDASKYERDGYAKRTTRNLSLLARYFGGASIERLKRDYEQ